MDEAEFIWMDGELVNWDDAQTHVLSHGLHYGTGVFEGIRAYDTDDGPAAFRLPEHIERFLDSASICQMDLDYSQDELRDAVEDVVAENGLDGCYIRPIAFRGYKELGVDPTGSPINVAIAAWPWGAYLGEEALENGVDIMTSSWTRHHPNVMPTKAKATGNYVNSAMAKMEAVRNGFHEAIMLTPEGYVAEGSGENVFVVRDGDIITPPSSAVLEGITRDTVMTLAEERGYDVREERMTRDQIYRADEAFFTGTAAEVTPIASLDRRDISDGRGPVTEELQAAFMDVVHGDDPDHTDWLDVIG